MKPLLALLCVFLAALGIFLAWGPPAFAARERAHLDLLQRERALAQLEGELGVPDESQLQELLAEHAALVETLSQRAAALAGEAGVLPRLPELLARVPAPALQPGGALHAALRAQAGLPPAADADPGTASGPERALARILAALVAAGAPLDVATLELKAGGVPADVPDLPGWRHVEAQLVASGALPDVLDVLEQLAPGDAAPAPLLVVREASLRRIEGSRWGDNVHRLETPPVRVTATLDVLFAPGSGP